LRHPADSIETMDSGDLAANLAEKDEWADVDGRFQPSPDFGPWDAEALLPAKEAADFRRRWDEIQTAFVDQPLGAVEQADALVAAAMKRLADVFAAERVRLEGQCNRNAEVAAEDPETALQRYRVFFGRLLSV
jgi:hypothetical protein